MNNLNSFQFESKLIRVVVGSDGEPRFVASDALRILDLDRTSLERLDDDEKGVDSIHTLGGIQTATVLSESGLYTLVLGSRKAEAKAFKKWITSEVLPSIRKTGKYSVNHQFDALIPKTYPEALRALACTIEAKETLACQVKELAPKAEFADRVSECNGGQSIGEVAKVLGTGQNRLFAWLRSKDILMSSNQPYQEHVDLGRFQVICQKPWKDSSGQEHLSTKTLITGKGLMWLQKKWDAERKVEVAHV